MKGGPAELALAEALADFTLKVATPINWHDRKEGWPKRVYGGTCFFLRFTNGIIGVTANHVLEALQMALRYSHISKAMMETRAFFAPPLVGGAGGGVSLRHDCRAVAKCPNLVRRQRSNPSP